MTKISDLHLWLVLEFPRRWLHVDVHVSAYPVSN